MNNNSHSRRSHRKAFTLIELLVVIAIIAILASILFPVFSRARENARRSSCASNQKQLALGLIQYSQDFDERLPNYTDNGASVTPRYISWTTKTSPYVKSRQLLRCPSAKGAKGQALIDGNIYEPTYGMPGLGNTAPKKVVFALNGLHMSDVKEPARTWLLVETASDTEYENNGYGFHYARFDNVTEPELYTNFHHDIHFEGSNVAFVDGHVKWIKSGQGKDWIFDNSKAP